MYINLNLYVYTDAFVCVFITFMIIFAITKLGYLYCFQFITMNTKSFYGNKFRRVNTLCEAVEELSTTTDVNSIVILPPSAGDSAVDSDVEDIPENLEDDELFETAGQLEIDYASDEDHDEEGTDPGTSGGAEAEDGPPSKTQKLEPLSTWKKTTVFHRELRTTVPESILCSFPLLTHMSPMSIWSLIFDSDMIDNIVQQSNLYAARDKNCSDFKLSDEELRRFLGIVLLSGYHSVPSEADFWSNQPDLGVELVSEAMSRNRFQTIKRFLHVADNATLTPGDKTAKISPVYSALNRNLVQFKMWHSDISIDESMVPYFGRHSMKMFIKGKPIRFGYKLWSLCGSDGYPYHLKIYQGREVTQNSEPLGTRVVNHMINVVDNNSRKEYHHLFIDNFFTSYNLIESLADRDMKATGTVRENRSGGANKKLPTTKEMKRRDRGSFDFRSDKKVYIVKWHDNSVVSLASNCLTHEPVQTVNRRVKGNSNVAVTQPHIVKRYNEGMGGVDLMDRLLSSYRPLVRGKKWWWSLFINVINVSVVAAWRIHCASTANSLTHLAFRRQIVLSLVKGSSPERPQTGGGHSVDLPRDVRFDGASHDRQVCSQGRCKVCHKNTRYKCVKCNIRLHSDKGKMCFSSYHTQP